MKKFINCRPLFLMIAGFFASIVATAQEKSVDININKGSDSGNFLNSYWVWILVAAVFILLLVALSRRKS